MILVDHFRTLVEENPMSALGVAGSGGATGAAALFGALSSFFGFVLILLSIWLTILSIQAAYRRRRRELKKEDRAQ